MLRFLRTLVLSLILAALVAAGVRLWLSPDAQYDLREWFSFSRYHQFDEEIHEVARRKSMDPALVKAVVWRESTFHPHKVGGAGERGLMQVTEGAAQDWAKAEKIETFVPTDLFDPKTNIEVGAWYLERALRRWKDRDDPVPFALAEYNAGRTRVDRWIEGTGMGEKATAADFMGAMDFPTTRKYILDITARRNFYKDRGRL